MKNKLNLALIAVSLGMLLLPMHAFAATYTHKEVIKTGASVPSTWRDPQTGQNYLLQGTRNLGTETANTEKREFSATSKEIRVPLDEVTKAGPTPALKKRFAPAVGITTGGFAGRMDLVNITTKPISQTLKRQVDKIDVMYVDTNDIEDLPKQKEFMTTSGKQTLKRASVSFAVIARDDTQTPKGKDGKPSKYKATLVYRGVEAYQAVTYCLAQAHYKGVGTKISGSHGGSVEATYAYTDASPIAAAPALETTQSMYTTPTPAAPISPEIDPPSAKLPEPKIVSTAPAKGFPVVPVAAASSSLLLFFVWFSTTRNARLIAEGAEGSRVITRARIRKTVKGYECTIPPWVSLPARLQHGETALLEPNARLTIPSGAITVKSRGEQLYYGPFEPKMSLSVQREGEMESYSRSQRSKKTVLIATTALVLVALTIAAIAAKNLLAV